MYYIFGFAASFAFLIYFVIKLVIRGLSEDRGEIFPHILALKCGALALYPTYFEFIDYCYGFMTLDLPWLNDFFASIISEPSDITPEPYLVYYTNLSLASTFLLATVSLGVLSCILLFFLLVC